MDYQDSGRDEGEWISPVKEKMNVPLDVYHIIGITVRKNFVFDDERYFRLNGWQELYELNRCYREANLWSYDHQFLSKVRVMIKALGYDFEELVSYFPRTVGPLILSAEGWFCGDNTCPVFLIAPKLQFLKKLEVEG
jgi:hypothetical protein